MTNLKDARTQAAALVQDALSKRVEELKQTDAFKQMKAEVEHFEENGNPDNLHLDEAGNLCQSQNLYVPAELCAEGDSELIAELLKECSEVVYFYQDQYSRGYDQWTMEQCFGEPVTFDPNPERGYYAIHSDELGLKVNKVIDEEHGFLLIERAMRKAGVFGDVVKVNRYGEAFYRPIPKEITTASDAELAAMLAKKEERDNE